MADDHLVRPLREDDQFLLHDLVRRNGLNSVLHAMSAWTNPSSRASNFSASTLISNNNSAPSLCWTSSEASLARSDGASIRTQSTWTENSISDIRSLQDTDSVKQSDPTWLDSPAMAAEPMTPGDSAMLQSPRLVPPTNKKYQCPMCFLDNNPVGFGRKSDFKKHLHNFHGADVVWICHFKGCHLSFSTERAYSTHAKETHRVGAIPSNSARTDLCPQLVYACGFPTCKDRFFEASNRNESGASRDKYFEHIAKHFEDGFDVGNWDYQTLIQNLMRQQKVKPIYKTCVWPKERRQQLSWQARSSGDLRRMLESRHLGVDVSNLVRLAYILGSAPFSSAKTPPPNEIDLQFQLPVRSLCSQSPADCMGKLDKAEPMALTEKRRASIPQAVYNTLSSLRPKKEPQSPNPANMIAESAMPKMNGSEAEYFPEPHPGTPMQIPGQTEMSTDAPVFAPAPDSAVAALPQQIQRVDLDGPAGYKTSDSGYQQPAWADVNYAMGNELSDQHGSDRYSLMSTAQASSIGTIRPATPVPHKRPASWSKRLSHENIHPKKKYAAQQVPLVPPTSHPQGLASHAVLNDGFLQMTPQANVPQHQEHFNYALPTRMVQDDQFQQEHHALPMAMQYTYHEQAQVTMMDAMAPQSFFIDDGEAQLA